jgi:16S rRNA (cytosine1402-N4)-methyltransferase
VTAPAPHTPVLLPEVLDALAPAPNKTVIDGTFGAGGYTRGILEAGAKVIAFDRDPTARRYTEGRPTERFRCGEGG